MSRNSTASDLSSPQPFQESQVYSGSDNRRQNVPQMQISSQDVRYHQASAAMQYQQEQCWPHRSQRRPQTRQAASSTAQPNWRTNKRPPTQSSVAASNNEEKTLRSLLTDQLFDDNYECMICMIKIEYVIISLVKSN